MNHAPATTDRELLARADLVPPLPELVTRLLAMLDRADTEPKALEEVLARDPLLAARLLAMVNSPWFGLQRQIHLLSEAVLVVGFRGLRSLVIASSAAKYLQRDFTAYGHGPKGLWAHSVATAAGARHLASTLRFDADATEHLFLAGLLHDIGMFVLAPILRERPADWLHGVTVTAAERAALGVDHAAAGALVAAHWNLGAPLQALVAEHHDDRPASTKGVAVVRLADAVAESEGIGYLPGRAPRGVVHDHDLALLGVPAAAWPALRDEIAQNMRDAEQSLARAAL